MIDYERRLTRRQPMQRRPPPRASSRQITSRPQQPVPSRPVSRPVSPVYRKGGTTPARPVVKPSAPRRPLPPRRHPRPGWEGRGPWVTVWQRDWDDEPNYTDDADSTSGLPASLSGLSRNARRLLWRSGLLDPFWLNRLARAPAELIHFIRRFFNIAGFELVVKAFFGNKLQRRSARMAIQLAQSMSYKVPGYTTRMLFSREVAYAPRGAVHLTLQVELDDRYYVILPWTELDEQTVRKQYASHQSLFGGPGTFRWVLSGRALGMRKREVTGRINDMTGGDGGGGYVGERPHHLVIVLD